ncbi:hypothetical protein ACFE04_014124 [Oxalis oulophora]
MVLWEITLATAYFLGLKRTYRLANKIERRLISPNYPNIRSFVHQKTRLVFDVALKVHRSIQERDIDVGRSIRNWMLRMLDRAKPSAHIRGPSLPPQNNTIKQITTSSSVLKPPTSSPTSTINKESGRHLFAATKSMWRSTSFNAVAMMMRTPRPAGTMTQHRQLSNYANGRFEGVIRKDIMEWMHRN